MKQHFLVDHLGIERLLSEWRWLCPYQMVLIARRAFGDLFLRDDAGAVFWLETSVGELTKIASPNLNFVFSV